MPQLLEVQGLTKSEADNRAADMSIDALQVKIVPQSDGSYTVQATYPDGMVVPGAIAVSAAGVGNQGLPGSQPQNSGQAQGGGPAQGGGQTQSGGQAQGDQATVTGSGLTLQDVSRQAASISVETLASEKGLTMEVQRKLSSCGLLDPPADGLMGPVSLWALDQYCKCKGLASGLGLSPAVAAALVNENGASIFPIVPKADFTGKVVSALQRNGYWIARHPSCYNIVYIEGMNPDGTPNSDAPNIFDDLRMLIQFDGAGNSRIAGAWEGTVKASKYWTDNPMDPNGAARIAFGQYKSWCVGIHHPGTANAHEALVQTADIVIYRDTNKTYKREGRTYTGIFAINQHWGYNAPHNNLGTTSAGCLVGRLDDGHRDFMSKVKSDPRYVANQSYRFMTAVLPAADIV